MSSTDIYRLGRNPDQIGSVKNAWRGAKYVWNDIAKRYFRLEYFPMFDDEARSAIWNAPRYFNLPLHERIVLATTMDKSVVCGRDIHVVASAFDQYAASHPNSSLGEQAEILRVSALQPADFAAWRQTLGSYFWGLTWDSDRDEPVWYDPSTGAEHFDAYADALKSSQPRGA